MEPAEIARHARQIRAMVRAIDDPEALAEIVALRAELDELIRDRVAELRETDGYSWAELARPLGVTRAAAQQRYGKRA